MSHRRRHAGLAAVVVVVLAAGAAAAAAPGASTAAAGGDALAGAAAVAGAAPSPSDARPPPLAAGHDATNETPAQLGLGPGEVTSETARPTARLGTAVAVGDDELRVRYGRYRARELLDSATTDAERRAVVRRVLEETERAVDRLRDREVAAVRAYRDGTIDRGELPTVDADPGQLARVFQNLIANAIDYAGEDPPSIAIEATEREDAYAFRVEDDGIGIPEDQHDRIFDIFTRGERDDEDGGTGIGLTLCRRIVQAHDGEITVDSEPGAGTTFTFTLQKGGEET